MDYALFTNIMNNEKYNNDLYERFNIKTFDSYLTAKLYDDKDKNYTLGEKDETICYCKQCMESYQQYVYPNGM